METSSWVSGGLVVARRTERSPAFPESLFPDRLVSVSERVAPILPSVPAGWLAAANAPAGRFAADADKYMGNVLWALVADLERFGLPSDRACVLEELLAAAEERGDFVAPSGFADLAVARRFLRLAGHAGPDTLIVGLSLPAESTDDVLRAACGEGFVAGLLLRDEPPPPGGTPLGFEVLGLEDGELVSWGEEFAADHAAAAGVTLNESGLLPSLELARSAAAFGNARGGYVHWAPWRLQAFPTVVQEDAATGPASDAA